MTIKEEIHNIMMQACEIKRLREQMTLELAEIERHHNIQCKKLAKDIARVEIKIALKEIKNE